MNIKSFEDLEVWQLSSNLASQVYSLTAFFPREEKYGIIDQLKRASVSVSANIAEGFGRYHYKDSIKFLYNARGSLFETHSHLLLAHNLGHISPNQEELYKLALGNIQNLGIKLNNFISVIIKKSETTE